MTMKRIVVASLFMGMLLIPVLLTNAQSRDKAGRWCQQCPSLVQASWGALSSTPSEAIAANQAKSFQSEPAFGDEMNNAAQSGQATLVGTWLLTVVPDRGPGF